MVSNESRADIRAHFRLFGYATLPEFLSDHEMQTLRSEIDHALDVEYGGRWLEGRRGRNINGAKALTPFLASLLEDTRFLDFAESLFDAPLVPWGVEANSYRGDTLGHVDLPDSVLSIPGCKFVAYLDSVEADTGALKFVPGSHLLPLRDELFDHSPAHEGTRFLGADREMDAPFVACETDPGDVVVFHESIWHATRGGVEDRRMATLIYHTVPDAPDERMALGRYLKYALGRLHEAEWVERATTERGRQLVARMEDLVNAAHD